MESRMIRQGSCAPFGSVKLLQSPVRVSPLSVQPIQHRQRCSSVIVRADRRDGGFLSGFVVGGVVFGTLGFLFAPQISRALLGEEQRIRLPRFLEDEDMDPEVTKQNLAEKIAQLNAAIDDVSAQLKTQESMEENIA